MHMSWHRDWHLGWTVFLANIVVGSLLLADCRPALAEDATAKPLQVSGIYPNLTMRNREGECGTGAVVPWQGSLWAITYAPHQPGGSTDKLYEITPDLQQRIFEGSVGGTPANRMIHRESNQLLIGPYLIDAQKQIRIVPPSIMFGRLTGNARHLLDPANKVYYGTMEEGLYEVDVNTLAVKCWIRDGNKGTPKTCPDAALPGYTSLPGYHGKGLYSSQGRVVYANNGEHHPDIRTDPTITSGALAQWFGEGDWQLVRRNQFTEVSGPGGIFGNEHPEIDPIWSMGWDAKSLIFALLDGGEWHYFRLPKGSHSYDGSHGWNTEWPRIRDIGEKDLLATMHGTFWRFPKTFSLKNSAGIAPRSNYLKVVGDFCRWNDKVVLGCDDSAQSEFINKRTFKAKHGSPKQSNSNLWFIDPQRLDQLGPAIGRGAVWLNEDLAAGTTSEPYLFSGYDYRQLCIAHSGEQAVTFTLEVDRAGNGTWEQLQQLSVSPAKAALFAFDDNQRAAWVRLTADSAATGVTAHFQYRNRDMRPNSNNHAFDGIATANKPAASFGLMRSLSYDKLGLVAAANTEGKDAVYYEVNQKLELVPVEDPQAAIDLVSAVRQPAGSITIDDASVLLIEDGKRYRLPKSKEYAGPNVTAVPAAMQTGKTLVDYLSESLAIGATATASSTHEQYVPAGAVDGSLTDDDRWVGRNDGETWIELDLGKPKTFRSVWVASGWDQRSDTVAANFDIQVKDGDSWKTIPGGEVRDNTRMEREIVLTKPITAQHLRLTSGTNGFLRVYEIALFDRVLEDIIQDDFAGFGEPRICREVATERDLLNVAGIFYELPARNAQGLAKTRPVATHNLAIHDFCSHNGLLLITGIDAKTQSEHIFRSADGNAAIWAGAVDDLWSLGKARGVGGPWKETAVKAEEPSDAYLMTGFDRKTLTLSTDVDGEITAEIDLDGTGLWTVWKSWQLKADTPLTETLPESFGAYWIRFRAAKDCTATACLVYE